MQKCIDLFDFTVGILKSIHYEAGVGWQMFE